MRASYLALAAALAWGVSAGDHHAHHHEAFHLAARDAPPALAANTTCGCGSYTVWVTTYGESTLYVPPPAPPSTTPAPAVATVNVVVVPTPAVTTFATPGTYTIPAVTVTLTSTTTVCAATSTSASAGTYTLGGVTTVVSTSTTVVCPLATTTVNSGVITSVIVTTTYVCPSAGTYTIGPITTTVVDQTVIVYPTPASYPPGTYTQPQAVVTITETDYVVFCPFTPIAPPPAVSTAVAAIATSAPPPAATSASSSPGLGSGGNKWAITYTPYTTGGLCKSAGDVLVDITTIKAKGFSVVRIYATDCGGLDTVGAACEAVGLKMIIGVFINGQGIGAAQQQVTDIITWSKWSLVELIVIGNEAISSGSASAQALVAFISSSKSAFQGAGYTGPCTTTEPLDTLQQYASLICAVVDVTGANLHPFFNPDVTAADAGAFVAQELAIVDSLCEGKSGINLETGWPSGGNCNGAACPGSDNQQVAVESILSAVGGQSVLFSFVNDPWKAPGQFDCEQFWGAIHLFS